MPSNWTVLGILLVAIGTGIGFAAGLTKRNLNRLRLPDKPPPFLIGARIWKLYAFAAYRPEAHDLVVRFRRQSIVAMLLGPIGALIFFTSFGR